MVMYAFMRVSEATSFTTFSVRVSPGSFSMMLSVCGLAAMMILANSSAR